MSTRGLVAQMALWGKRPQVACDVAHVVVHHEVLGDDPKLRPVSALQRIQYRSIVSWGRLVVGCRVALRRTSEGFQDSVCGGLCAGRCIFDPRRRGRTTTAGHGHKPHGKHPS